MHIRPAPFLVPLCASALLAQNPGYTDTPKLPDQQWHVHDPARPHPRVVEAAPAGAPVAPPKDAIVLFGGTDLAEWRGGKGEAKWTVQDGAMQVNGSGNIQTTRTFGDCQLHLEFATPSPAKGESQHRGNSGVFLMGRYEVQVLDSFENVTYADGQCAALYGQFPPLVNASRKPGEWQTYDIFFAAPRFDAAGKLLSPARVTVVHNGVVVHNNRELLGPTAHRSLPQYRAHEERGPLALQDHGDPVRFRNIWVRDLAEQPAKAPAEASGK